MGLLTWVTLPVWEGKPSRNCAQELDGTAGVNGRAAFERRQRAVKAERAARRSERSALRLEVVQRELIVFEADAHVVGALDLWSR